MHIKSFSTTCLALLISILASCENADRDGVTLTPKPSQPGLPPPSNVSNQPLSIISAAAKCLAVYEPDFHNSIEGSKVQTVGCVPNSIYQNWHLTQQREILSDNGQCLAPAGDPVVGVLVVLNDCDGSTDQKWVLDEQTTTIHNETDFHLCLEMPKLTIHFDGSQLILMPCHGEENQQWVAQTLKYKYLISALNAELISMESSTTDGAPHLTATRNVNDWLRAAWTLEPVGNFYRIRSRWRRDHFLHVERGSLEASAISPYWDSAIWAFIRQDNRQGEAYLLRNVRLTNIYIGLDANHDLKAGTFTELVDGSTLWQIVDVNEGI